MSDFVIFYVLITLPLACHALYANIVVKKI